MYYKNKLILILLLIFSCENPISNQPQEIDCVLDKGGFLDDCGICSGGSTSHVANSDKDCSTFIVNVNSQIIHGFSMTGTIVPNGENLILTTFNQSVAEECITDYKFKSLGGKILKTINDFSAACDFNQSTEDINDDYELCLELDSNKLIYSTLFDITNFEINFSDEQECLIEEAHGGESDIDGICFGDLIVDDCGICGGECFNPIDNPGNDEVQPEGCLECGCFEPWGTCLTCAGATSFDIDESGTIDEDEEFCNCEGSLLDDCGVCGGTCFNPISNPQDGDIQPEGCLECGCAILPQGDCDCLGTKYDCSYDIEDPSTWSNACGGSAVVDQCGVCDSDLNNNCIKDCKGVYGGLATYDDCGYCGLDTDPNWNICECSQFPQGFFIGSPRSGNMPATTESKIIVKFTNDDLNSLTEDCLSEFVFSSKACYDKEIEDSCTDNCIWQGDPGENVNYNMGSYCGDDLVYEWGNNCTGDVCLTLTEDSQGIYKNLNYTSNQEISKFHFRHNGCILDYSISTEDNSIDLINNDIIFVPQTIKDCLGACGGTYKIDECGICVPELSEIDSDSCCNNEIADCNGECPLIFENNSWLENSFYDENNILDDCGVCEGTCFNPIFSPQEEDIQPEGCLQCGCSEIPEGFCDCNGSIYDCNQICGGPGVENLDDATCCASGIFDCNGICDGDAIEDCNGICNGNEIDEDNDGICDKVDTCLYGELYTNEYNNEVCCYDGLDCLNICGGLAIEDDCGLCNGDNSTCTDCSGVINGTSIIDCSGECGGSAIEDECGVCGGVGPIENYDCYGNCVAGFDCNGVCGGLTEIDECGVCGGGGINTDNCGVCNGNNISCDIGLITLVDNWNFNQINLYDNSDCSGFPYYSFNESICLDGSCYDYRFAFEYLLDNNTINKFFTQTIIITNLETENNEEVIFTGDWDLTASSLCIDYESGELEDFCFESLEFENEYYDCVNNVNNCINNSVIFTNVDTENNLCSKEAYFYEPPITFNNNDNLNLDIKVLPLYLQNIILFYKTINNNAEQSN